MSKNLDLTFWVAYQMDGKQRKYLSDGKGHLRVFKSEEAINKYLEPLTPEEREKVTVHFVQGKFAIPEPQPSQQTIQPITSLAAPHLPPLAAELLDNYKRRHGIK